MLLHVKKKRSIHGRKKSCLEDPDILFHAEYQLAIHDHIKWGGCYCWCPQLIRAECEQANVKTINEMAIVQISDDKGVLLSPPIGKKYRNKEKNQ